MGHPTFLDESNGACYPTALTGRRQEALSLATIISRVVCLRPICDVVPECLIPDRTFESI